MCVTRVVSHKSPEDSTLNPSTGWGVGRTLADEEEEEEEGSCPLPDRSNTRVLLPIEGYVLNGQFG